MKKLHIYCQTRGRRNVRVGWARLYTVLSIVSVCILFACMIPSCSTTRVLAEGESRLAKTKIEIEGDRNLQAGSLNTYIKQKPNSALIFGWNPFLNVYNWGGHGTGLFSRFFRQIGTAPVVFSQDQVSSSVENMERHLEYMGYYGSKVIPEVKTKRRITKVRYTVIPGKRYPISRIDFEIPASGGLRDSFLSDTSRLSVKKGMFLSESVLEAESERGAAYFRQSGYFGFSKNYYFFRADTLSVPGTAILEYRINEYTRNESPSAAAPFRKYSFGNIEIEHPASFRIREKVLGDLTTIRPGDMYAESDVTDTYTRLSSINMLSGVNINVSKVDSATVDAKISLTASKRQGFKFNIEGSSNSSGLLGISPGLSFYHRNLFRGGEVLNLNFMGNFQFKPNSDTRSTELGISTGLRFPRFLFVPVRRFRKSVPATEIKASYNYQDRPEYRRNIISTSFGYSGWHKKLFFQVYPVQLNIVRLFNMDPFFYSSLADNPFMKNAYQDHFDLGIGGTLYYTTNRDANPKKTYHYFRFQANSAGNLLSLFSPMMDKGASGSSMIWNTPYSQYIRGEFSAGKTWVFGDKIRQGLATRFLAGAGYAYGNSSSLPFEQHFYSGGANSLRGWQARSIGPGNSEKDTTFVIPNQTGDMKMEANVEYRFGMFWKINGAVFLDCGNIWTIHDKTSGSSDRSGVFAANNFLKSLAADWGIGLRLDMNFILLRLDMGMILRDPSRPEGQRWRGPKSWLTRDGYAVHFGVGYPF